MRCDVWARGACHLALRVDAAITAWEPIAKPAWSQPQFDSDNGGCTDLTFLALAQPDATGNVSVSCFGGEAGRWWQAHPCITERTARVVRGISTGDGLEVERTEGQARIVREAPVRQFVDREKSTFSNAYRPQPMESLGGTDWPQPLPLPHHLPQLFLADDRRG
jgi:hypothetical protein